MYKVTLFFNIISYLQTFLSFPHKDLLNHYLYHYKLVKFITRTVYFKSLNCELMQPCKINYSKNSRNSKMFSTFPFIHFNMFYNFSVIQIKVKRMLRQVKVSNEKLIRLHFSYNFVGMILEHFFC